MDQTLERLQRWYLSQCNGDWEHSAGVRIDTLDNPGWSIKIDLAGTALQGELFEPVSKGLTELDDRLAHPDTADWYSLRVKNNTFEAAGDPSRLGFMLDAFLDWATEQGQGK